MAASRSTWSEPMPAVIASFRFGAFAIRSAVRYAGQNGWEITTSASGSSRSKTESAPSLSEVTTSVWPWLSRKLRRPSSPDTLPSSSPGVKSIAFGVGAVCPPGYDVDGGDVVAGVAGRVPVLRVVVQHTQDLGHDEQLLDV